MEVREEKERGKKGRTLDKAGTRRNRERKETG